MNRRSFLASAAAAALPLDAARLDKEAYLWDVQVGSFTSQASANRHARSIRQKLEDYKTPLNRHVLVAKEGDRYSVLVDTNAIPVHATGMLEWMRENEIVPSDSFLRQRSYFFNDRVTDGRNAHFVLDSLPELVRDYTTAYVMRLMSLCALCGDTIVMNSEEHLKREISCLFQYGFSNYPFK